MAGITVGNVLVDVLPDARGFNEKLAAQLKDLTVTVGVNVDAAGAIAKIDEIKAKVADLGTKTASVNVNVNGAAAATAQLAAVSQAANNASNNNDKLNSSSGGASGGMSLLMKAAIGLSPALIPVGAAALGVAAALGTMAAAGAAGVGVLSVALAGVTKAVGLLGQQQQQQQAAAAASSQAAASNAQAIVAAQRGIQSAEMSLGDARRAAATSAITSSQQVASAQYALIQADQQERTALAALQSAREAATRQLQSMANAAVDARLAEQQATLDLQTAIANNNTTQASSTATAQQKQQASLDLAKAQQHLTEAQQANTNAAQDNTKAQKLGVDGAPQVVSATQGVAAAQRGQEQAAQSLANAQRNAAQQQIQSSESIVRAQQGVAAAMDAMTAAQRQSAGSTSASLAAINAQVAALDPATRSFAEYLRGTWAPIWKQVQSASAGGFLPGLQAGMDAMKSSMPGLVAFIRDISTRLGDMAKAIGEALASPFWQSFFSFLSRTIGPSLSALGGALGNIIKGFAGLWMAFEPIIKPITDGIVGITKKFADFGTQAASSPGFAKFIKYVQDSLPLVGRTVGDILRAVGEAISALAPLGRPILQLLDTLAKFLANTFIPFLRPIVRFIADQVAPVFEKILGGAIDGARVAFQWIMKAINDNRPQLEQLWKFIRDYLAPVIGFVLKVAFEVVGAAIGGVIGIIGVLVNIWNAMWQDAKDIGHWFANDFVGFFVGAWHKISEGWAALAKDIGNVWQDLKHYVMDPVAWIIQYVIDDGIIGAWDWVSDHLLGGALHVNRLDVPAVPPLAKMATGGAVSGPGTGTSDSILARLSHGEFVVNAAATSAFRPLLEAINGGNHGAMSGGLPGFKDGGGVWGFLTDVFVPGAAAMKAASPKMAALMSDPASAIPDLVQSLMGGLSATGPLIGMLGKMMSGMAGNVGQALLKAIGFGGGGSSGSGSPGAVGSGVERWRGVVDAVLAQLGQPSSLDNGVLSLIQHESGGNPNAINLTDSNAKAGHPSQGLMQTIPSTFAAYAGPYASRGITDPFANIYAGVNYALQRYGPGMLASGGRHNAAGQYIGYDFGGTLDPGYHMIYNGTGATEIVAPRQTFEQVMSGASGGSGSSSGTFTGNLYLDSGEFLGKVRGVAQQEVAGAISDVNRTLVGRGVR